MKLLSRFATAVLVTFMILVFSSRYADALESQPQIQQAYSAIVTDSMGNALYEKNADEAMDPASITKIMTAMVALDSGMDLDAPVDFVPVSLQADSQMAGYVKGDTPTLRELLLVTLVYSGNDAATNLAYAVSGDEASFCGLMNQKAQEIGMTSSHFSNPHGLMQEGHYATARDLARMGRYALENYPFIADAVRLRYVTAVADGLEVTLESTDDLMEVYEGLLGIKTGNVESGSAFLSSATRNGITLYSCVLGCFDNQGRFDDTAILFNWAFDTFTPHEVARRSRVLRIVPWAYGSGLSCLVSAHSDLTVRTWPEGEGGKYHTVLARPGLLVAANSTCGYSTWTQRGRFMGGISYEASSRPVRVPAWNIFTLPIMVDREAMAVS